MRRLSLVPLVLAACATAPRPVTKIVNGKVIVTRPVSPGAYEHVTRALLHEEEGRWDDAAAEIQRALPYDDEAPELRAHLAEIFIRLDRLDDAQHEIEAAAAIAPTVDGFIADAHLRQARGDRTGAVESLRRAAFLTSEDADDPELCERAHLELSEALIADLDVEGAFDTARELVRLASDTQIGRIHLAGLAWAIGRLPDAETALKETLAEEPAHADAMMMLGQLYAAEGRIAEAKAVFRDAMDRSESSIDVAVGFARWLVARGDRAEAEALADRLAYADEDGAGPEARSGLERAAGRPDKARAIAEKALKRGEAIGRMTILAGLAAEHQKKPDEAASLYLSVGRDLPEFTESRVRAAAVLRESGKLEAAERAIGEAAAAARQSGANAVKPRPTGGDLPEEIAITGSQIDEKRGDLARAARRLDEALRERPDSPRLRLARASVEERRGDWRRALEIAGKILEQSPADAAALNFLGFVAADHGHDLPRALRRAQAAMALEPGTGGVIDSVGWAHFRLGHFEPAALFLEEARQLEPGDPEILGHIGDLYASRKDRGKAVEAYKQALARTPPDKLKKDLEDKLRALEARKAAER